MATLNVQRICQPLVQYKSMTSSRWRVILSTEATGLQSWDGSTQLHVTTSLMTSSPWQPMTLRLHQSWQLQQLLIYTDHRLFVLLSSLNYQHLCRPPQRIYRFTNTHGCHQHSTYCVSFDIYSRFTVCGVFQYNNLSMIAPIFWLSIIDKIHQT